MIDLSNKEKRDRLLKSIKNSRQSLLPFRRVRKRLIQDYVGSWWNEDGAESKTLVNLINQTAKIYTVSLAANTPQVLVTTPVYEYSPFAKRFDVNLNKLLVDMNLDRTFRSIVLDAFFCIGCSVTMMRDTDTEYHGILQGEEDIYIDPGEPWVNRVSVDDLILDMSAKELSKMRYCGHRYRADYEKVMDEGGYSKKVRDKLTPESKSGREKGNPARDMSGYHGNSQDDDLKDMVWLQDIWIAENNCVVTMACDQNIEPLIEREWTGGQTGPYDFLSLGDTPDNVIPTSPGVNLKGLHDFQNRLHRRMESDSDAHRKVNVYPPGGQDDASKIQHAERNSWHRMADPKSITQVEVGGIDQGDMALASFVEQTYDRMAGNLQAMGGLGAQSGTVGQEELIMGQLSKNVADMRMQVVGFASNVCLKVGRLMWEDEVLELQSSTPVGDSGIEVSMNWEPGNRVGEFEDYGFRVEPYSMSFKTPEQKLQELFKTLDQLAPLWPMMQASGATLDARAIVDEIARLKNRPEFRRFITFTDRSAPLGGDQNTIRQSPVTRNETIRRNIPTGGTQQARTAALVQSMMGGGSQTNSQMAAAMGRSPA